MSLAYMVQIFFFDIFFFSCPWPTWVRHLEPHRAEGQSSSLHGVFYANFGKVRRPAASTGWAPDGRDRCWVRPLSCAKVLAESDQAFGREGRIADPRRQEPDVIGNATTPQIGGFYANFGKVRRPAASTGWAPDHRGRCWVRPLSCAKVLAESDQAFGREGRIADPRRQEPDVIGNATTPQIGGFYANFGKHAPPGGINREGPRSQGPLLGTSSLVCESSDRIGPGTRPGGANRGPPSPRARRLWTLRYFRHSGTCLTDVSAPTGPPIAGATAGYVVCVVLTFGLDRISHLVGRCESPTPSSWGTERRWPPRATSPTSASCSALCRAPRTPSFHQVGAPCRAPTAAGREPRSPPRPHFNNGPGLHANARGGRSAAGPHEPPLRRVPPALHFAVHPEHRLSTKSGPRAGPPLQPGESPAAPLGPTLITDRVFTLTLVGDGAPLAPTSHLSDECLLLCTLPCTQNTVFPPSRGPVPGPHCSRARAPQPPSAPL